MLFENNRIQWSITMYMLNNGQVSDKKTGYFESVCLKMLGNRGSLSKFPGGTPLSVLGSPPGKDLSIFY